MSAMKVTGVPLGRFRDLTMRISAEKYHGNVIVQHGPHALAATRFEGFLTVESGDGPGARTTYSGRRGHSACWHAYRDVLEALFQEYPNAIVQTSLATYHGQQEFREDYPDTAYYNIGSTMQPANLPELCACDLDWEDIDLDLAPPAHQSSR